MGLGGLVAVASGILFLAFMLRRIGAWRGPGVPVSSS